MPGTSGTQGVQGIDQIPAPLQKLFGCDGWMTPVPLAKSKNDKNTKIEPDYKSYLDVSRIAAEEAVVAVDT